MLKNILVLLLTAGSILAVTYIARKGANFNEIANLLDWLYIFYLNNFFEITSVAFMVIGIWNSIIRKRIIVSAFCFLLSFVFSFLIPFLKI